MKMRHLIFIIAFLSSSAFAAQPVSFTYQGKALNAAGTSPLTTTVSFTLSITDPSGACLLYQESQSAINLATTNGLFALQVGSQVGASKRTSGVDPGLAMTQIFANAGTQLVAASGSCTSGYTPAANDPRKLHVVVTPTSGSPITITPDLSINAVPNAMVADSLQGYSATQLLTPAGTIISFSGPTCPTGYLAADGSSYSTTAYSNLFGAISYGYGGSGATFSVPNASGLFLRGVGSQTVAGIGYSSGTIGSTQTDQMQGHHHSAYDSYGNGSGSTTSSYGYTVFSPSGPNFLDRDLGMIREPSPDGINGTPRTGAETRPVNLTVKYCVKY
jgi:microcystin-dependent protein